MIHRLTIADFDRSSSCFKSSFPPFEFMVFSLIVSDSISVEFIFDLFCDSNIPNYDCKSVPLERLHIQNIPWLVLIDLEVFSRFHQSPSNPVSSYTSRPNSTFFNFSKNHKSIPNSNAGRDGWSHRVIKTDGYHIQEIIWFLPPYRGYIGTNMKHSERTIPNT